MKSKQIIFSAPSGSGKSTIINYLLTQNLGLEFSISATSRPPRGTEKNGVEYYFFEPDLFRAMIAEGKFLEYEEVYQNRFYGTLKSEVDRIAAKGKTAILDLDVVGGYQVKQSLEDKVLTVFIQPPSVKELRNRLELRATDPKDEIEERIKKAEFEMGFAKRFDVVIINDDLEKAKSDTLKVIQDFLR